MMTDDFMYLAEHLTSARFQFAKTAKNNPHWYTLRQWWRDDDAFLKCYKMLFDEGYPVWYWYRQYWCININGYFYWGMTNGESEPYLINRKVIEYKTPYDEIANTYDDLFVDEESLKENEYVMNMVDYHKGEKVLDIGCGTGLFLDMNDIPAGDYTGIDASKKMLEHLEKKHEGYNVINTKFEDYYSTERYDKVIALFGTASYIDPICLDRIKRYLSPTGKAYLMFYKEGYEPVTYIKTGIKAKPYRYIPKNVTEYHNYDIVEVTK